MEITAGKREASPAWNLSPSLRRWGWFAAFAAPLAIWPLWRTQAVATADGWRLLSFAELLLTLVGATVAYTDIRWHRIPNWITYPAILWGVGLNAWSAWVPSRAVDLGAIGLFESMLGMCVLFFGMLIVFSFTGGGAGDVKLAGGIGALLGLTRGIDAVLAAMIIAGIAIGVWILWRHGPFRLFDVTLRPLAFRLCPVWFDPPSRELQQLTTMAVPLGPFFAVGILFSLSGFSLNWLRM
jgi:Flp pilus assembly protein protease CpaA